MRHRIYQHRRPQRRQPLGGLQVLNLSDPAQQSNRPDGWRTRPVSGLGAQSPSLRCSWTAPMVGALGLLVEKITAAQG